MTLAATAQDICLDYDPCYLYPSPLDSQFVSQSVPTTMTAGQTYSVSVTMKNIGTTTWTEASQYRLGSQNPQDNTTWGGRILLDSSESIIAGQKSFNFNVVAPSVPGAYNFQWRMVQDGVEWFGDYTPNVSITVTVTACVPSCSGKSCGPDGCNGTCGSCAANQTCNASGQCVVNCVPKSCNSLGFNCGTASDGCGITLNCGTCTAGFTCTNNRCVSTCVPKSCLALSYDCGTVSDGCGKTLNCGTCAAGSACTSNKCVSTCVPKTCADLGYFCGTALDGCGGTLNCGICSNNNTCYKGACVAQDTANIDVGTDLAALYAQIEYLKKEISRVQALLAAKNQTTISCTQLTKNLYYGMKNDQEVKCLQKFLKSQGFFSGPTTGNYFTLTKTAVIAFQEKYASEILVSLGLTRGTGIVAGNTRAKINELLAK